MQRPAAVKMVTLTELTSRVSHEFFTNRPPQSWWTLTPRLSLSLMGDLKTSHQELWEEKLSWRKISTNLIQVFELPP